MSDINDLLIDISSSIAKLEERLSGLESKTTDSTDRVLKRAKDHSNHLREIQFEMARKISRDEIKPLLAVNWILTNWNWKVFLFILLVLSALGLIQVNWETWKMFKLGGGG
jgi:hypothetical protein